MAYVVRLPGLGMQQDRATLVAWHVAPGEPVAEGDLLAEVETEKAVFEVEAREDGVLRRVYAAEGDVRRPNDPLGIVAAAGADVSDLEANVDASRVDADRAEPPGTDADASATADAGGDGGPDEGGSAGATDRKVTPRARRRAAELDVEVDLDAVEGTGVDGAVTADDVERAAEAASAGGGASTDTDTEAGAETSASASASADASRADAAAGESTSDAEPERVTPRARRRAEELGVDLAALGGEGTGPGGAVTADDVEAAAEREREGERARTDPSGGSASSGASAPEASSSPAPTLREERPFSETRRTIARRLHESYADAVHVTLDRTADAEALLDAADAADRALGTSADADSDGDASEDSDVEVSMMDVLLVALSAALSEHPTFNATVEDETLRLYEEYDVGIAVDADRGLVTPVLRDVGSKSLAEVAGERRELTERVLADEFAADDLAGGTITVTNLGPLGVESFDPVINPPQVAILGVNAVRERATRAEGDGDGSRNGDGSGGADGPVAFRRRLPLSLSFDHRAVDGADAARFLDTLVDHLEDPWPLLPDAVAERAGSGSGSGSRNGNGNGNDLPERSLSVRTGGGTAGTVSGGSFEWAFDESEDLGGSGTAPSPVDRFLGALASCLAASVGFQASKRDLDLSAVRVDVEGRPAEGPLDAIEIRVGLDSSADDDALARAVAFAERGCYVARTLRDDLPVEVTWERL